MSGVSYTLESGKTLTLNDRFLWVVINPNEAGNSSSACVVAVHNCPQDTPHFIYFLKKRVCELESWEFTRINREIVKVYPTYQDILDAVVEPIAENGQVINSGEFMTHPRLEYFDLAARAQYCITESAE